ncbi:hypothetical protein I6N95_03975 [Vagococcus sp. BWB3-3]|uniref:Uncharacterized protein n=1 Tax=Vagococcus allomyrinae TaxID=2794353 RepID=A0A940P822_9ENTE|nr:hypothetical protein [Vagococcus allomyrinae]MBP1040164.1 hypothetical protein [Vagococcus allomyrinae]
MINLDWLIIGAISLGIICLLLLILSFAASLRARSQLRKLGGKPTGRSAKKKWRRQKNRYTKTQKSAFKSGSWLLLMTLVISGIGGYAKYYQMTNMTAADTENIVTGYYLLDQMTEQLNAIESSENDEKLNANIHTLAVRMASFSSKKGSDRGTKESQLLLNRYYARMGQLGVNLASQKAEVLKEDQELLHSYIQDIERVEESQNKVLAFYQVDEKSLAQKQ